MWYKNIAGRFFGLVTKHACNRRTDGQNYDSQDRASIAHSVKISQHLAKLQARKLIASRAKCAMGTVLLKDEEPARYLEYGKKQSVANCCYIGFDLA